MQLFDAFQSPLGLAALLAVVPIIVLYLIRPDPREVTLPTLQFLLDEGGDGGSTPVLERLTRNLLLLLQLLAVVLVALAIASPTVSLPESGTDASVIVLDASASMATETGDGTRFEAARRTAADAVSGETTLVVTGARTQTVFAETPPDQAREAIAAQTVSDGPGDLRSAVAQATADAGSGTSVLVVSDFVDESGWRSAVQAARARGAAVELRQFDGGGANAGFVARDVTEQRATFTVTNYGASEIERTVTFAGQRQTVRPGAGDSATVSFPLPEGGGTAELTGDDALPTDDTVPVATPRQSTLDVVLLTNAPNRFLVTSLEVNDAVSLTVKRPPTTISADNDVVIFGAVRADAVLDTTVETAREIARGGGGVAVVAREDVGSVGYGDLLAISPDGVGTEPRLGSVARDPLTEGFEFSAPDRYVRGNASDARTLVELDDGTPLLAVGSRGDGRVLYYGYISEASEFENNYRYPVFWKRAVFYLADRPEASALNRRTGQFLTVGGNTTVTRPDGSTATGSVLLDRQGYYTVGQQRYGAALLQPAESNVTAPSITDIAGGTGEGDTVTRQRTVDLTPIAVLFALLVLVAELLFLRYRGDL